MANRLSHTSLSVWQNCPKSYEYRYIKKLYPLKTTSSLVFGKAIDVAIEYYLHNLDDYLGAKNTFLNNWKKFELNKKTYDTYGNVDVHFSNRDLDLELIIGDNYKKLLADLKGLDLLDEGLSEKDDAEQFNTFFKGLQKQKDEIGYDNLKKELKMAYNMACYYTLECKGICMLLSFKRYILPQIESVISTQEVATVENESGDSVKVIIDAVLKWKGVEEPVIFDFKTAARPYEENAVLTSHQLAMYVSLLGEKYKTRKCGYIVFSKIINKNKTKICSICGYNGSGASHRTCPETNEDKKRCGGEWIVGVDPTCSVQVLVDSLPESTEELVMDNMDMINKSIYNGIFTRNISNCINRYNTKCDYYAVCHNKCYDGLVKPEE